jgi:hypothetical protein
LDAIRRRAGDDLVATAGDVALRIRVGMLTSKTATDALGELHASDGDVLHAVVAHALESGTASAQQLGTAVVYLLGVPATKLRNFFDARAVGVWKKQRAARRRNR